MSSIEEVKEYYEERTKYHEKYFLSRNSRMVQLINFIDKLSEAYPFKSALDIGCGVGITSERLRTCAKKVTAIDLAENAIKVAKERNLYGDVEYLSGDFTHMKLGRKYDLVCIFDVIEHILPTERDLFLNNVKTHSSGIVAVSVPKGSHTKKVKENGGSGLQIVDEEIYDEHFKDFEILSKKDTGVYMQYILKPINI
jgi:2-polyprenyl-3-methyl-5-hydroxy-6-metoxy-1,4-benzoquinol methylase